MLFYPLSCFFGDLNRLCDHCALSPYFLWGKLLIFFCVLVMSLDFWWSESSLRSALVSFFLRKRGRLEDPRCSLPVSLSLSLRLRAVRERAMFLRTLLILASLLALPEEALALRRVRSYSLSLSMLARRVWESDSRIFWLTFFYTIAINEILKMNFFNILIYPHHGKNVRLSLLSFKVGRVVVITQGRHAGKKAVVVKAIESGNKVRAHWFRNTDSLICWLPVSLVTSCKWRERTQRRNSSRRLEWSLSLNTSIKTTSCLLDSWSTTSTLRTSTMTISRPRRPGLTLRRRSETASPRPTLTSPTPRRMRRLATPSSSSAGSDSDGFDLFKSYYYSYTISSIREWAEISTSIRSRDRRQNTSRLKFRRVIGCGRVFEIRLHYQFKFSCWVPLHSTSVLLTPAGRWTEALFLLCRCSILLLETLRRFLMQWRSQGVGLRSSSLMRERLPWLRAWSAPKGQVLDFRKRRIRVFLLIFCFRWSSCWSWTDGSLNCWLGLVPLLLVNFQLFSTLVFVFLLLYWFWVRCALSLALTVPFMRVPLVRFFCFWSCSSKLLLIFGISQTGWAMSVRRGLYLWELAYCSVIAFVSMKQ